MKLKTLTYVFIISLLIGYQCKVAISQNPLWTIPGNSIYFSEPPIQALPLPIPSNGLPGDDYEGEVSEHAHNAISKPNGELFFFVVDGRVFDGEGRLIGRISIPDNGGTTMLGGAEITIVPDPSDCDRFYIVTSGRTYIDFTALNKIPYYVLLDMSLPNLNYPEEETALGQFVNFDGTPANTYPATTLATSASGFIEETNKQGCMIAATDERADGSRFLFLSNGYSIFRYRVNTLGLNFDNYSFSLPFPLLNQQGSIRSEMEVIDLFNGGFRVAVPYVYDEEIQPSVFVTKYAVFIADLNNQGELISSSSNLVCFEYTAADDPRPYIHGLEFSPDGDILYITHNPSSLHPNPIEFFDLNDTQSGLQPLIVSNATDFQNSQIEIGVDQKLYFATSNRMASLENADDPANLIWNDNAISGITYNANYEGSTAQHPSMKLYILPDQIDTMDYSIYPYYPYNTVTVSNTETWTPDDNPLSNDTSLVRIEEELRIVSGTHITIKNMRFEFFEDARVVVEPGAHLTLDSTIFTIGPCDAHMWLGVEVWGTSTESQYVSGYQGHLELRNNSIIEHAYIGALAGSREDGTFSNLDPYEKAGGIIRGFDSRFRNNMYDVFIQNYYSYAANGTLLPNRSRFSNCDFLTDGLLNHPEVSPLTHAALDRVHNVRFDNCSFRNTSSFLDIPINQRGIGIYAIQATFKAIGSNDTYEPAEEALDIAVNAHQSFYKLKMGVVSIGNENHFFTVDKMEFQLNKTGIWVLGSCYETITFNNFEVPEAGGFYPQQFPIDNIGVYLTNSYGFTVEENYFFSSLVDTQNGGLVVDNSSMGDLPVENEVYRNEFYGLNFGIGVKRDNRGEKQNKGLQARCNVFSTINIGDIILNAESEWRDNQGEATPVEALTNNLFSHTGYFCSETFREVRVIDDYGILSGTNDLTFDYFHLDDPISTPDMDEWHPTCPQAHINNVLEAQHENVLLDYEEHCPSNFTSGGGIKWPLAELEVKLATAESNLASAQAIYKATIDGGETDDVIDLLENVFNEESSYLRNLLMAKHPLSKRTLMAAIDAAESFDPWHLTQVLVANSKLPGEVYRFLKDNDVLAPFFMQFVNDAQTSGMASFRTLLLSEISLRSYEKSQTERAIHRHYLHHTDSLDGTAWNNFLESRDESYYQLYRIGEHIDKGETASAQTLLDSLDLITDRTEWVQFMIDLAVADTVTATDISTGWNFFDKKPSTFGHAWGWLMAQGELDSIPSFEIEPQFRSFSLSSSDDPIKSERWLEAWPNPAKDRVVLTYPREADGIGIVQLFNADGRMMKEFAASDNGFQEINLTGWPTGIYIAKLIVNDKAIDTVKVNVVK